MAGFFSRGEETRHGWGDSVRGVSPKRPINADVPGPAEPEVPPSEHAASAPPPPTRRSRRVPGAIKLVAALVLVALGFIVLAVLGGRGGEDETTAPVLAPSGEGAGSTSATASELGFPVFATGNTTRVGGSDPTTNAAGVALAVFPSTTTAQRPAAVTLVGAGDWTGGIAAAVLMAAPVGAPILLSTPGEMPAATESALAALSPQGSRTTGGSAIFSVGNVAIPGDAPTTRIASGAPASVAAAIARLRDRLIGRPPTHIVVASSVQPGFAMPAAAWAARSGDPVLFADPSGLPDPTAAYLRKHRRTPVYVLGPSSAISSDLIREIDKAGGEVRRVSGETAVATAIALARYRDDGFGWNVNDPGHGFVLARSDNPLNAAAAAPLSASGTWGPMLLTDSADTLPDELRSYFLDVKPGYTDNPTRAFYNHVWVIGDQEAIDLNQQAEANELAELAKIGGER